MIRAWFQGRGRERSEELPVELPPSPLDAHLDPEGYLADNGLVDAVNVALFLGRPLLLTGEPGTGKTQLAYRLAWELGFGPVLRFETKSTSRARDLFYTYDAVGHFQAAQAGGGWASGADPETAGASGAEERSALGALDFIHWNALGSAILFANQPGDVAHLLPSEDLHATPRRSVVLVDEVDKAPRDFPNDLLNELQEMFFRVPELGNLRIGATAERRPVLVLTSNSEKNLPEAFARRCVFYEIPFPRGEDLVRIVESRLGERITGDEKLLEDALSLFERLRDPRTGLSKKPSTAEFLDWLTLLENGPDWSDPSIRNGTLSTLIKDVEDRERAKKVLQEWTEKRHP